ncbi:MAG: hypothetical protein ACLRS8_15295 [Parabacteroides merdae]
MADTHDVDAPFFCRTFRNLIRETVKGTGLKHAWKMFQGPLQEDPFYTFPWLVKQRNKLKGRYPEKTVVNLCFLSSQVAHPFMTSLIAKLHSKDLQELLLFCKTEKVQIGLHTSYDAGKTPALISTEKEGYVGEQDRPENRSLTIGIIIWPHANRKIWYGWKKQVLQMISRWAIRMLPVFRLGTSRPKYIGFNPENKRVSRHPFSTHLAIMGCESLRRTCLYESWL